jgi:hypothetical protein
MRCSWHLPLVQPKAALNLSVAPIANGDNGIAVKDGRHLPSTNGVLRAIALPTTLAHRQTDRVVVSQKEPLGKTNRIEDHCCFVRIGYADRCPRSVWRAIV